MATEATPLAAARGRRVVLIVVLAAVAAAAAIVGATLLQTRGERTTLAKPSGRPPLELNFGVAGSLEARRLALAQALYDRGDYARAAALFSRYRSPAARIGAAFANWEDGDGLARLQQLAAEQPRSPLVALHLGWANYYEGENAAAVAAWRRAARLGANSPYGVSAEDVLHAGLHAPPGLPPIVTGIDLPARLAHLSTAEQLAALKRAAAKPDERAKLLYGSALWTLEEPVSAERELAAAARLAPHDPIARAAAAVGLFSKADPVKAFGHLGPLTAVFPKSPAVEFHLGVLLLYIGQNAKAADHLRAALADGPHSPYAKPARTLLTSLAGTRSK